MGQWSSGYEHVLITKIFNDFFNEKFDEKLRDIFTVSIKTFFSFLCGDKNCVNKYNAEEGLLYNVKNHTLDYFK
jgi:hypothetical protein